MRVEATAIEAEIKFKSILLIRFRAAIGADLPTIQLAIMAAAAILLVAIVVVGVYFILNSPGAARL